MKKSIITLILITISLISFSQTTEDNYVTEKDSKENVVSEDTYTTESDSKPTKEVVIFTEETKKTPKKYVRIVRVPRSTYKYLKRNPTRANVYYN